ncbi:UNVERIFIED_CONTAM: protein AUXIN RESPONSE 4 [Sesamum angustifolium]|uniref:Protein AUXIN RESPONSE 4 n=1 Tax=Sesamum angustifolium TaxID=2727405 RepID=A0AAW2QB08_9LAMI
MDNLTEGEKCASVSRKYLFSEGPTAETLCPNSHSTKASVLASQLPAFQGPSTTGEMAIITEEPDSPEPPLRKRRPEPKCKPTSPPSQPASTSTSTKSATPTTNPFHFWFCFTFIVSLVTLFCFLLTSLSPKDPKTWFLSLPPILRNHYSNGRTIKVAVLLLFKDVVKFLGRKDVHAVAIDLPGSGFSDKSIAVVEEIVGGTGFLGGVWEVYEEIKEKGLFWGFDQLVEQGYVNFEENKVRVSKREIIKAIELGSEEMGRVLAQVVDSMGLAPVDLVLHDSGIWDLRDDGLDCDDSRRFVFERVVATCCMTSVGGLEAEAHRILLKGRDGGKAVAGMVKKLNFSFDLSEWSSLDGVKGLPIQVIWSGGWSDKWTTEGRQIAGALPQATLVNHSGGDGLRNHIDFLQLNSRTKCPSSPAIPYQPWWEQNHIHTPKRSKNLFSTFH